MRTTLFKICWCTLLLLSSFACRQAGDSTKTSPMAFKKIPVTYPATRQDSSAADTYFGARISDPYRWLEDDQSPETKDWVKQQNGATFGFLEQIPFREKIKNRLEQIWNFEKFSPPFKKAGVYYYFKNDGLQNQSVLYAQDDLTAQPRVANQEATKLFPAAMPPLRPRRGKGGEAREAPRWALCPRAGMAGTRSAGDAPLPEVSVPYPIPVRPSTLDPRTTQLEVA